MNVRLPRFLRKRWTVYYVWSAPGEPRGTKRPNGKVAVYESASDVVAKFWLQETAERCADLLWIRARRTQLVNRGTYVVREESDERD